MANLVIDIGNTRTKIAFFNHRKLQRIEISDQLKPDQLLDYILTEKVSHSIVSSVNADVSELETVLEKQTIYKRFSSQLKTKVNNLYKAPENLGLDRLAAIIGAQAILPDTNCLVIDAGTCITYDAIDKDGAYFGGSISPGLHMRLNALHTFTGRLPVVDLDHHFNKWSGSDTKSSILSGVIQGAVSEILGFIKYYNSSYQDLHILLCGGDANFFDTRLKNSIFADAVKTEPHLVLIGLNEVIYQHND